MSLNLGDLRRPAHRRSSSSFARCSRRLGQVLDLVRIGSGRTAPRGLRLPEARLGRRQLALVEQPLPDPRRRRLEHVVEVLAVRQVRHVVADVDVAAVA